jgi:hypothetical protein
MMMDLSGTDNRHISRRSLFALGSAALGVAALGRAGLRDVAALAPVDGSQHGDMPTTGGMRPGPVGLNPVQIRRKGVTPVAMKIEKAQVDAQVEPQPIQDGVMLDPSGPFVIAWYEDTGKLGQQTNLVFAGHLDYYDVGQAVFFDLWQLAEGDQIQIIGEDQESFLYSVEWGRNFTVDELTSESIQDIVGKTDTECVTLITCGGPFDYNVGQYLDRFVVRANRAL